MSLWFVVGSSLWQPGHAAVPTGPASASVCAALTACVLTALTANTPTGLSRKSPSTLAQPLASARPSTSRAAHHHTATTLRLARTRQRHRMPPCPRAVPPLTTQAASLSASTQHPHLRGGLCWAGGPVVSLGCRHPPCRLHTAGDSLRGCDSNQTAAARRCLAVGALREEVPDGYDSSCCNRLLMFSTSRMTDACWAPCLHAACSAPLRSEAPAACRPLRVPLTGSDSWVWVCPEGGLHNALTCKAPNTLPALDTKTFRKVCSSMNACAPNA